jgi:class 3 adenylate cyclase
VRLEFGNQGRRRQCFLQPTEIQISNDTELPVSEYYLIHPALDQSIYERSAGKFTRGYDTRNIIGNQLEWEDPITYSFVLKGDMVGYSQVMDSELYEIVTRKLYEWARETCRDLMFVDVSGGDSILMIDGSAERIVRCATELVRRAGDFQERPMKMRFGGAAGPIAFERMRRMHNGSWDTITVPMGLALRTSALLEPLAAPGCVLVEERFHQFASGRDAHSDAIADSALQDAKKFSGRFMAPLSQSDVPDIDYDWDDQKFVLRKNLLDPPYHTRLWKIELA